MDDTQNTAGDTGSLADAQAAKADADAEVAEKAAKEAARDEPKPDKPKPAPKGETPTEALFRIASEQTGAVITYRLSLSGRFEGVPEYVDAKDKLHEARQAHAKVVVEAFDALVRAIHKGGGTFGGELAIDDGSPQNVTILQAGDVIAE